MFIEQSVALYVILKSMNNYYVYILTTYYNTALYIGVTNNLERRIFEHNKKFVNGFCEKYNINKLVYYEETNDIYSAITREKQLKKWDRQWKIDLINEKNPEWKDLYNEII